MRGQRAEGGVSDYNKPDYLVCEDFIPSARKEKDKDNG
jgi:hypothetical protein